MRTYLKLGTAATILSLGLLSSAFAAGGGGGGGGGGAGGGGAGGAAGGGGSSAGGASSAAASGAASGGIGASAHSEPAPTEAQDQLAPARGVPEQVTRRPAAASPAQAARCRRPVACPALHPDQVARAPELPAHRAIHRPSTVNREHSARWAPAA